MMISALHSVTVFAQKRTISGTVVDERNEPLIGATIVAEGKSGMTITNVGKRLRDLYSFESFNALSL